ncbi:MAG: MBOAT family protein [Prevotella sp.]|nr:MBOAT family protein [Prevotella sp.]
MIYNSFNFIVIFPLIFLLYYVIPARFPKARNMFLLITSYLLYVQWKPSYTLVLLGVTLVTYFVALLLEKTKHPKRLLTAGMVLSLLPLAGFKYFNFINESVGGFLSSCGIDYHLAGLNWAIPIGISFFTFQALGYLFDVYFKRIEAERDFLTYALFISFFPSILSGPINKAALVIPQLKRLRVHFDYPKAVEGLKMLLWGMFMKVVVADRVALFVDNVFPYYMNYRGSSCLLASFLYTIQIYADFGGYSLMALGVGKTLGFELTENFRRPYFSYSITDFWRRWHISLSTWLKDYVYIPLGGSHCSKARNYWNIFVTFLVSGIWHGANWTFVVWGILHGLFQIVEKMTRQNKCSYGIIGKSIKILITFLLVNFLWIFFRSSSIGDACGMISRIFSPSLFSSFSLSGPPTSVLIVVSVVLLLLKDIRDEFFPTRFLLMNNKKPLVRWCTYVVLLFFILLTGVFNSDQFIYANF